MYRPAGEVALLWPLPEQGEHVFLIDLSGPAGYLEIYRRKRILGVQLHLQLRRRSGALLDQQTEVMTVAHGESPDIWSTYQVIWRQLTLEEGRWFGRDPIYSSGSFFVSSHIDGEQASSTKLAYCIDLLSTHKHVHEKGVITGRSTLELPDWAQSWVNIPAHLPSDRLSSDNEDHECHHSSPLLPDLIWPWLLKEMSAHQTIDRIKLISSLTGSAGESLVLRHASDGVETWLRLIRDKDIETVPQLDEAFSEQRRTEKIVFQSGELLLWQANISSAPWTITQGTWSRHRSRERTELNGFKVIQMKGDVPWHRARWVSLKITSPIRPLETERQVVNEVVSEQSEQTQYQLLIKTGEFPEEFDDDQVYPRADLVKAHLDSPEELSSLFERLLGTEKQSTHSVMMQTTQWVDQHVSYRLNGGFPEPIAALQKGYGDCNERAAVLAFALNKLGFEVEEVFGLLRLTTGQWGLHAWVRVRVGQQWIEIDPNHPTQAVRVDHIGLVAGKTSDQSRLTRLLSEPIQAEISAWSTSSLK